MGGIFLHPQQPVMFSNCPFVQWFFFMPSLSPAQSIHIDG